VISYFAGSNPVFQALVFSLVLGLASSTQAMSRGNGTGVDQLRAFANSQPDIEFVHLRDNPSVAGERREVVSFEADGLLEYALVLWPGSEKPDQGWPVLLFNHGYHPNPPEYGRIKDRK